MKYVTLLLLIGIWAGVAAADQNDPRLDGLFEQLKESANANEADALEARIWAIWLDNNREDINQMMARGTRAMSARELDDALEIFNQMVQMAPDFAEGWNKRATVYYLRDELNESVADVQRTLTLEPRHFGALSGMGLIFMQVGDEVGALRAFEEVLKLSPQSSSARIHIERLRQRLKDDVI